jgi:hypothetical protein
LFAYQFHSLGSFSSAPLWCLDRLPHIKFYATGNGIDISSSSCTEDERAAYIDLWRHIGFYLGISHRILKHHFTSPDKATKFLASTILHLLEFPQDAEGKAIMASAPTIPILLSIANRPPFPNSFERNCALTRMLIGNPLATHLSVPSTSRAQSIKLRLSLYKERVPQFFGEIYPRKGWEVKRRELVRIAMARIVRWQLGMRKTMFRPRKEDGGDIVYPSEDVRVAEEISFDPAGREKLGKDWKWLMIEMTSVLVGSLGVVVSGACLLGRRWI